MSTEEYRTESFETYGGSSESALQRSESEQYQDHLSPVSDIEREIEDEHYDDSKTHVEMMVQIGKTVLKPLQLSDCYTTDRPGMFLDILPKVIFETVESDAGLEEIDFPKPIFRLTIDQGTIATVEYASSSAQTLRSNLLNSWCQYEPRLFSEEECKVTMNSQSFGSFMKNAEKGIFEALIQNRTADSFFWELKSLHVESSNLESSKESSLVMKGSFVCFEGDHKQLINFISWHPALKDIFIASTLRNEKIEKKTLDSCKAEKDSYVFYVWSCKNQFMPKIFLHFYDEIAIHKFNPTMPNIIVGGSLSGQLVLWNLSAEILSETSEDKDMSYFEGMNTAPNLLHHAAISNPDHNHTRGIKDCVWIPSCFEVTTRGNIKLNSSNESYQIVTSGSDGIFKFWDLRSGFQIKPGASMSKMFRQIDGKWEPFLIVEMQLEEGNKSFSVTKFVFKGFLKTVKLDSESSEEDISTKDKTPTSTEFYAGCENGEVFCGNFKLIRDDSGKFLPQSPVFFNSPHSGPITAITISPFICDIFISTGSRTVCIWKHDLKEKPVYSRDMHAYITSAEWSNTRPAVFILGYEDGAIEVWDLLENIYEPFLIHFVSTTSITSISMQTLTEEEHVVAVGDLQGIVYVLQLPSHLWMPVDNELTLMEDFVKKEGVRMEKSCEDIRSVQKTRSLVKQTPEDKKVYVTEGFSIDGDLQTNYKGFSEIEQMYLSYLGLMEEESKESKTNIIQES